MRQYKIVEVYDEKTVETTTDDFEAAIQVIRDQQDGNTTAADTVALYSYLQGKYVLIGEIEL
jgi:hypothetical protein